jgi:DNA-binding IclR family transcriptional regulator
VLGSAVPGQREGRFDSSASRAIALLDAFDGPRPVLGVSELAATAGMAKSTAHRLLRILISGGYVHRVGEKYVLSRRVFELGNQVRVARPDGLRDHATPYMAELFALTRDTVNLAVLSNTDVLYVDKLFGHTSTRVDNAVGSRRPAYATALGKAMLAFSDPDLIARNLAVSFRRATPYTVSNGRALKGALARVRERGYATDFEESALGVVCLAVPVLHPHTGLAVAALSLSGAVGQPAITRHASAMLRAAEQLSAQLTPAGPCGPSPRR